MVDNVYKTKKPIFELTKGEAAAVTIYASDEIYEIDNRVLRTEELANIQPWFSYLKLFHTAINKISPEKNTFCRAELNGWIDFYEIGSIVTLVNQLFIIIIHSLINIDKVFFTEIVLAKYTDCFLT